MIMLRITAKHMCAGVFLNEQGLVIKTAPILHYMMDWNKEQLERYCHYKNWECEIIE